MEFHIHGARGSSPVSGPGFERYGGHTSCYSSVLPGGRRLILDCGSGLLHLRDEMTATEADTPFDATVFLTHFHWDHIQGLPFFEPIYQRASRIHFVAAPPEGMTIEAALDGAIRPPWFPVHFRDVAAQVTFEPLTDRPVLVGDVEVASAALHHPGGVQGYRVTHGSHSLVLATDVEAGSPEGDEALRALADGASVLIHDAQYTPDEWSGARRGWGHSTWEQATGLAHDARVRRLVLTSHDPRRSDDDVDEIVRAARSRFAETEAAFSGQVIEF